jgi:hypothetical protein
MWVLASHSQSYTLAVLHQLSICKTAWNSSSLSVQWNNNYNPFTVINDNSYVKCLSWCLTRSKHPINSAILFIILNTPRSNYLSGLLLFCQGRIKRVSNPEKLPLCACWNLILYSEGLIFRFIFSIRFCFPVKPKYFKEEKKRVSLISYFISHLALIQLF